MQEIKKESINIDRSEIWQNRLKWIMPVLAIVLAIIIWELLVKVYDIPHYLIPAPSKISSECSPRAGAADLTLAGESEKSTGGAVV